ncbi:MAG: T9SS type A sorting domain-containing protein [Bacteroidia bacterium]
MKKSILTIIIVFFINITNAQITIDVSDMPSVNDTIRISSALPSPGIDVVTTGANQTWDYSNLSPLLQRIDTFRTVSSTGTAYAFFFVDNSFNTNRANLAIYEGDQPSGGGINITESYSYFYKNSALFKQVGVAGKLNGFPTPVAFSPQDVIYNFPLNFGNQDSSNSGMTFNLPNTFYYSYTQKRVNQADGWGSLTTPYGTFSALRVKSIVNGRDSVYVDSLSNGFAFTRPLLTEHKWLGKQQDLPLLKINTQTSFGIPIVSLIEYRDSARVLTSIEENAIIPSSVNAYPNPFNNNVNVEYTLIKSSGVEIAIYDMQGREVYVHTLPLQAPGVYQYILGGKGTLSQGSYFLKLTTGNDGAVIKKLIYLD